MSKIAVTGDLHLKVWSDTEFDENGIPLRLKEILNSFQQICKYCIKNSINKIIIAGDINDKKNIIDVVAFTEFKKLITNYSNLEFIIIHGNHDASQNNEYSSAIEIFNEHDNVTTIKETIEIDGIRYIPFSKHIREDIDKSNPCDLQIGHFGISDACLSSGISIRQDISSIGLKKFKLSILGHYHKPQEIRDNTIIYVGSPIQLRRDEVEEEKRFIVVDTETLKWESIPITGYRKYYRIILDDEKKVQESMERAKKLQEEGNYVILVNELKYAPAEVPESVVYIDNFREEKQIRGINVSMGLEEQMKKYLEIKNISPDQKEKYIKIGNKVLSEESSKTRR